MAFANKLAPTGRLADPTFHKILIMHIPHKEIFSAASPLFSRLPAGIFNPAPTGRPYSSVGANLFAKAIQLGVSDKPRRMAFANKLAPTGRLADPTFHRILIMHIPHKEIFSVASPLFSRLPAGLFNPAL
jgi:hypothetical protein